MAIKQSKEYRFIYKALLDSYKVKKKPVFGSFTPKAKTGPVSCIRDGPTLCQPLSYPGDESLWVLMTQQDKKDGRIGESHKYVCT